MGFLVCGGALLQCSFGAAPSSMMVLPANKVIAGVMPAATIMDNIPSTNILPFGACSSMANPTVASATAAAQGVLTPMPCVPVTVSPWAAGRPTCLIGNYPLLSDDSVLTCMWGGVIKINSAGQTTTQV